MPRQMHIEYPGAICHVMSRGDRREDIFPEDVDRQDFLKTFEWNNQGFPSPTIFGLCTLPACRNRTAKPRR